MSVMITRLLTGEEILGVVSSHEDAGHFVIENPTTIGVMNNPQTNRLDIHMAPFLPLAAKKSVVVNMQNVVCQYEPVVEVINKFNSVFGSGIILPKGSGLATID